MPVSLDREARPKGNWVRQVSVTRVRPSSHPTPMTPSPKTKPETEKLVEGLLDEGWKLSGRWTKGLRRFRSVRSARTTDAASARGCVATDAAV